MTDLEAVDSAIVRTVLPKLYAALNDLVFIVNAEGLGQKYRKQVIEAKGYLPAQYSQSFQQAKVK